MGPELWRAIKIALPRALELSGAERRAYLEELYSSEPALREELESLLASYERHSAFLETPLVGSAPETRHRIEPPRRIRRLIGQHRPLVWTVTLTSLLEGLLVGAAVMLGAVKVLHRGVRFAAVALVLSVLTAAFAAWYYDTPYRRSGPRGQGALLLAMLLAGIAIVWCFTGSPAQR
jgi:hypothetical protein